MSFAAASATESVTLRSLKKHMLAMPLAARLTMSARSSSVKVQSAELASPCVMTADVPSRASPATTASFEKRTARGLHYQAALARMICYREAKNLGCSCCVFTMAANVHTACHLGKMPAPRMVARGNRACNRHEQCCENSVRYVLAGVNGRHSWRARQARHAGDCRP